MKKTSKVWLLSLLFLLGFSCKENNSTSEVIQEKKTKTVKSYGLYFPEQDSISVNLNLDDYKTYGELKDRLRQIVCSDRIPKITLENDSITRKIYFPSNCDQKKKEISRSIIKNRNVIEITGDQIVNPYREQYQTENFAIDSLTNFLKLNLNNFGKNESLSTKPEDLHIVLGYLDESSLNQLKRNLLDITKAFDKVGGNTVLKILIGDKLETAPPPPPSPPAPIQREIVEVVEDDVEIEEIVEIVEVDEEIVEIEEIVEVEVVNDEDEINRAEKVPFSIIEDSPIFKGCNSNTSSAARKSCTSKGITNFFNKNFNTSVSNGLGLSGVQKIFVLFTIDIYGNVRDIKSRAPHPTLAEEAERIARLLPRFKPGEKRGKAVNVDYTLPIVFKL